MPEDNNEKIGSVFREGINGVVDLVHATANSKHGSQALENLGKTAVVVTNTINNVLLPLAAFNYGCDQARKYFENRFSIDIEEKIKSIPPENIIKPRASIAGPVLQGLAFTHDEPDLKNLFLNLLSTAMDDRKCKKAHPAFVDFLKQITADEAFFIKIILSTTKYHPLVNIYVKWDTTKKLLENHVAPVEITDEEHTDNDLIALSEQFSVYVDNWQRMGLIVVDYQNALATADIYDWVNTNVIYSRADKEAKKLDGKLNVQRGSMRVTPFGEQFAIAVGILHPEGIN